MEKELLQIDNLSITFQSENRNVKAVDGISFSVKKGETIGIVGESGSGKSVTAMSLMRLLAKPPANITNGNIWFESPSLGKISLIEIAEKQMQQIRGNEIAIIFQEPMTSLNPVFTCGSQVEEVLLLHRSAEFKNRKQAKEKVIELFQEVLLPRPEDIYKSYPHQLSGGQKQRVMIAMSMSCNPALLIADEPTTALDVTVQKSILDLMKSLQKKHGMSILFISHDLGVIADIADKVVVMYHGKIMEQGIKEDIFLHPQHPYTKALLSCRPDLEKRLRKLPVVSDFMSMNEDGTIVEKDEKIQKQLLNDVINKEERDIAHGLLYQTKPLLSLKKVKTWYNLSEGFLGFKKIYIKAVDDVSFDVYPGETLGLVGESGCGKTTLGRTIIRLLEPTSGEIYFKEKNIASLSIQELRKLRKDIQIIFQDPYSSLNPRMCIGKAITEPMTVHGLHATEKERVAKTIALLERVGLKADHFYLYPHEFSGGQRQRIVIARALALNPQFIICDEPVSALDVSIQAQILNLLNELKRDFGFTSIFISHDLSVVKHMCDRMIVMKEGKIEEQGEADEIYAHPKSPYTRKLIEAIPKSTIKK